MDDIDKKSNISIYKDCPIGCEKCTKGDKDELICLDCFDGFILKNSDCYVMDKCDTGIWFKLENYIFKYIKIDECILIFEGSDLFLISDKETCTPLMDVSNQEYINKCLKNEINTTIFIDIDNANIYNSSTEGIIVDKYSEDKKIYFHLIKYKSNNNTPNISSFVIQSSLEDSTTNNQSERLLSEEAKQNGIIPEDFLIFKADIRREDTISMQVEYQIYNSDMNKINQKNKIR